jgi:putative ABC transport system permease protein
VRQYKLSRIKEWVLAHISDEDMRSSIREDLVYRFIEDREKKGSLRARIQNTFQFLIIVIPLMIESLLGGFAMFKNYIKTAFRNIKRHKGYSFINIFGLAVGMTVCLLMLMYVVNETSYDDFHKKGDRIYRISLDWGKEGSRMKFAGTMPAVAPALNSEIPEVEVAARVRYNDEMIILNSQNEKIKESGIFHADPEIFEIFSWQMLKGNPVSALKDPFSIVVSQKIAKKYFGNDEPIGQTLNIDGHPYRVTGLLKDLPSNTHLHCEILISYSTIHSLGEYPEQPWSQWGDDLTYFVLRKSSSIDSVKDNLNVLLSQNTGKWFTDKMDFILQPLSEIHWDTESRGDVGTKGNIIYVYLFLSGAILVLIIACFNFMNLSTSRYLDRMIEVGVRKVVGANRAQLIKQFLTESLLVATVSMICGVVLFKILNSALYSYLDASFVSGTPHFQHLFGMVVLMIIIVGLMAGSYPAWFMSKFHPVDIMKKSIMKGSVKLSFRNVMVVLQFAISIVLILGTLTVYQQINFMKNTDLGFDKEDVILSYLPFTNPQAKEKYPVLKNEFLKYQSVKEVTAVYTVPGINSQFNMSVKREGAGDDDSMTIQALPADFGFVKSMGLEIIDGRDFSEDYSTDSKESAILNETAVKMFGFESPVGEKLLIPSNNKLKEVTVIGVVKDFHVKSLHSEISPMMIYIDPKFFLLMATKIQPENTEATLTYLESVWKKVLGEEEFNYRYMKDAYFSFYDAEEKTGKLLSIFTGLALFISCLGLFGLASFLTNKRVKEIGIRKVLGATVRGIAVLYSKEFTKWVILSNIIAWPIAYYLIRMWLKNFAYKINLTPLPFVISGAAALVIALITVSFHAVKAATANPVNSLRSE